MAILAKAVFHFIPTSETKNNYAISAQSSSQRCYKVLEDQTLDNMCNRRFKKLSETKRILTEFKRDESPSPKSLEMVDTLQRMGIDYHFEDDIREILETHFDVLSTNKIGDQNHDMSQIALQFRLLRQEGFYVPTETVFDKFISSDEGNFKKEFTTDIQGLMELYEASQLSVAGEAILDEAATFSDHFLSESLTRLHCDEAKVVANTLKHPYHKSFIRPQVRDYLQICGYKSGVDQSLKQLAVFDYNMLQSFHQQEIAQISLWWKNLELSSELKFARNNSLDWFLCPMACFTNPSFSSKRIELAKVISLLHLILDVFNNVGTTDQLSLFADAVDKWEMYAANDLPDYMKICYKALLDVTDEIAHNMKKELGCSPIKFLRKEWSRFCKALLEDAKCLATGKFPKAEEYLKNTIETSGVNLVLLHAFLLLNQNVTKENVEIINNGPPIISSVSTILRLWSDLTCAKFGKEDQSYGCFMLSYMKENTGSSVSDARKHVKNKISETWKQLNCHCLNQNQSLPTSFTKVALNVARLAPFMFQFHDLSTPSFMEDHLMKSLIYQKIPPRFT